MFLVYSNCFYTHFIFYARGHATLENVIEAIYDGCVTIDIKQFGSKAMSVLVKCFIRPARRCTFLTQNTNVRYINSFTDKKKFRQHILKIFLTNLIFMDFLF
jgi:hypothetical protein